MNPLNECANCGEDFTSLRLFDAHIVSSPSESLFDCMTAGEMAAKGWGTNLTPRNGGPLRKQDQAAENRARAVLLENGWRLRASTVST